MDNKRGDIDWFIVTIIISILTLAVFVLIAIYFPFTEVIDRVACKESIVLRAALPGEIKKVSVNVKDFISVRCKTRNLCVTAKSSGKGNCTSLGKDFETKRLTGETKEDKETQIKMFLAREMSDCWEMFGEGKLQIFSRQFDTKAYISTGIICDRIEFDDSILGGDEPITVLDGFIFYMVTHKTPNQNISYMDYLRNTPEGESANSLYGSLISSEDRTKNIQQDKIILTNVKSIVYIESTLTNFAERMGGFTGGIIGSVGAFSITGNLKASVGIGALGAYFGGQAVDAVFKWTQSDKFKDDKNYVGGLILTDYSSQGFSKWNITSFENLN